MTQQTALTSVAISPQAVRGVLSAMRHVQSTTGAAGRPLFDLRLVEARLLREGIVDTPANRRWTLEQLLTEIVMDRLAALRGDDDPQRPDVGDGTPEDEAEGLAEDLRSGSSEREAWGLLYMRFLALTEVPMGELPARFGVGRRTITRRLQAGLRALAGELRSREAAEPSASEVAATLSPIERIRVDRGSAAERGAVAGDDEADRGTEGGGRRKRGTVGRGGGERPALREMIVLETDDHPDVPDEHAGGIDPARAVLDALRDGGPIAHIAADTMRALARRPVQSIRDYRLSRVATWCAPDHRLDHRFVRLGLMFDRGVDHPQRWAPSEECYDGLTALLESTDEPAIVLLGPPGSGKSSLLRHHELELAAKGLRGESERLSLLLPLNAYGGDRAGVSREQVPSPLAWIASSWRRRYPALPSFEHMLADGRLTLLLDGLNEIPHAGPSDYARCVDLWRTAIAEIAALPGNRMVFTCRNLDYSSPLSSETLPVPQARLEALGDELVRRFLHVHLPAQADAIWQALEQRDSALRELVRTPFLLRLLIEQAAAEGGLPAGEAALFGGFVRRALLREIERGHPALQPSALLTTRDRRGLLQRRGRRRPHALPDGGALIRSLEHLASGMQSRMTVGEMAQVRVSYDEAIAILSADVDGAGHAEAILDAGTALGVLDEDEQGEAVFFAHQRFQEYFAARSMGKAPRFERVARPWRADEVEIDLATTVAALPPAESLPGLPATGWEETTLLAAQMAPSPDAFVEALMEPNLVLAARAALACETAESLRDRLRWALVERSRDPAADARERIAAGRTLARLGDPRFERHEGPLGSCLLPPVIALPGGTYMIGDDDPLRFHDMEVRVHCPAHPVQLDAFAIGQFHVTNAEWALFMAAGGYQDPRWWRSETAKRWIRGENTSLPDKMTVYFWLERFRVDEHLLAELRDSGSWPEAVCDRMAHFLTLEPDALAEQLAERFPSKAFEAPRFWDQPLLRHPSQPVVGISLIEARAYAAWLSANSGRAYRVPSEVELEAATRGLEGRRYACGDAIPHALVCNSIELRTGGPTPIGVFPESDTPEGIADLMGNVLNASVSRWGSNLAETDFPYPYDPGDGREMADPGEAECFVERGGAYSTSAAETFAFRRNAAYGLSTSRNTGLRLVLDGGWGVGWGSG